MNEINVKQTIKSYSKFRSYLEIMVGAFLVAVSVNVIYEPCGLVTGGVSGLAIIVKSVSERMFGYSIPVWVSNAVFNIPLVWATYVMMGKKFLNSVLGAAVLFNVFLAIIPCINVFEYVGEDYVLIAFAGAVIGGVGMGMIFSNNVSIGGTDLMGTLLNKKMPHYSIANILMIIDGIIVLLGASEFGLMRAGYAVVTVYFTSKITDRIVEGGKNAKMMYIISEKYNDIASEIINVIQRGATGIQITGMYTKKSKNMLMCVASRKELTKILYVIAEIDTKAFVIIADIREVRGEGFIDLDKNNELSV